MVVHASKFPSVQIENRQYERYKWMAKNRKKLIAIKSEQLIDNLSNCSEWKIKYHIKKHIEEVLYILNAMENERQDYE